MQKNKGCERQEAIAQPWYLSLGFVTRLRSNLIHTQARLWWPQTPVYSPSPSARQNSLDPEQGFLYSASAASRATVFKVQRQTNVYICLEREECSALTKKEIMTIFTQKIPYLQTRKISPRWQRNTVLEGWRLMQTSGEQTRTTSGGAAVKWFSVCYYRKRLQCTHTHNTNPSEVSLVLWVSKHWRENRKLKTETCIDRTQM